MSGNTELPDPKPRWRMHVKLRRQHNKLRSLIITDSFRDYQYAHCVAYYEHRLENIEAQLALLRAARRPG